MTTEAIGTDLLLWTTREVARRTGLSERLIWGATAPRGPLPCVRIGRTVRYDPADVKAWLASRKEAGTVSE